MGGRREVSVIFYRPETRSDLKQERSFFRGSVSTFLQLVVAEVSNDEAKMKGILRPAWTFMVIHTGNVFLIDHPRRPMARQVVFETVFICNDLSHAGTSRPHQRPRVCVYAHGIPL